MGTLINTDEHSKDLYKSKKKGITPTAQYLGMTRKHFTDEEIKEAFMQIDLDRNGYVGVSELRHVLNYMGEPVTDEELDEMCRMVDSDGDGQADFDEFVKLVSKELVGVPDMKSEEAQRALNAMQKKKKMPPPPKSKVKDVKEINVATPVIKKGDIGHYTEYSSSTKKGQKGDGKEEAIVELLGGLHWDRKDCEKAMIRAKQAHVYKDNGRVDWPKLAKILDLNTENTHGRRVFEAYDSDKVGLVDAREVLTAMGFVVMNKNSAPRKDIIHYIYHLFDLNKRGYILPEDLVKLLQGNHFSGEKAIKNKVNAILSQVDKNGDGMIEFDEFSGFANKFPNLAFPAHAVGTKKK